MSSKSSHRTGVTLSELMISMALLGLASILTAQALRLGFRSYRLQTSRLVQARDLGMFFAVLDSEISTSRYGASGSPSLPTLPIVPSMASPLAMRQNTSSGVPLLVEYFYDSAAKKILRRANGKTRMALDSVEAFDYQHGAAPFSILIRVRVTSASTFQHLDAEWANIGW